MSPSPKFATKLPGAASRLAALLLPHIFPICSVIAPCDPGAAPGTLAPNLGLGTLVTNDVRRQFTTALDALVADLKRDRSILAAILCGSLSHDTGRARSTRLAWSPSTTRWYRTDMALHATASTSTPSCAATGFPDRRGHHPIRRALAAGKRTALTTTRTITDLFARLTDTANANTAFSCWVPRSRRDTP